MNKTPKTHSSAWRRTKIIATLGPASCDFTTIENLAKLGVDVFRINFSHGNKTELAGLVSIVREVEQERGRPLAIMGDIQGPKFRIGKFSQERILLSEGNIFRFDMNPAPGNATRVYLPHSSLIRQCRKDDRVSVDDGRLCFEVIEAGEELVCKVLNTGYISDRKGISFGRRNLDVSCISEKDKDDIVFALEHNFDWLALSFVQSKHDIFEARRLCESNPIQIAAKIERSSALVMLDEIIEAADAIMVARGDLGVENGIETIPALQKNIVRRCRAYGVPCIIATQMLETMVSEPVPTRAEVNDVASAVFDQADAVMLSAETAAGKYPLQAVEVMARVIDEVEKLPNERGGKYQESNDNAVAIACAACRLAEVSTACALVTYSGTGLTARKIAAERPVTSIVSLVPTITIARQLALVWGIRSDITLPPAGTDELVQMAASVLTYLPFNGKRGPLVITAGIPSGTPGQTNLIRLVSSSEAEH